MRYLNSRLCALLALGLSFVAVSGLGAQNAPAVIRGDVDGDGRVTRADADAVRAYLVRGTLPAGRAILPAGDANGDGRVTAADAALISRYVAGVDVSRFPIGRPIEGGGERLPSDGTSRLSRTYECTVDVETAATSCQPLAPAAAGGAQLAISLGTPYVTVGASGGVSYRVQPANEDTTVTNVRITSNISQPLGTTNGTDPHADGTRLVFTSGPTVTSVKVGTITTETARLDNSEGTTTIPSPETAVTHTNVPFYQYNGLLTQGVPSAAKAVRFVYSSNVKTYSFRMVVSAPVQFEHGWITVAPPTAPVLAPDSTTTLTGTVYNQVDAVQADGKTWSSSNTAVATVDPNTGVVTAVAQGTATITATSTVNANRTGSRVITVDQFPTITSTTPANNAVDFPVTDNIVINFSEAVNVGPTAFTLECPVGSSQAFVVSGGGTSTITLNPSADLPAAETCTVTVDGNQVTDVDTNDGPDKLPGNPTFSFQTAIQAVPDLFGTTTTGNVRINSGSTSPVFSVTTNDKKTGTTTISFAGWAGTPGKTLGGGDVVMTTSGANMGQFTYNPPAGFEGTDSLEYTIQSGSATSSAKVALPVSGMIWFINNAGAACTTRASGCGRLTNPYSSLAAFNAENNGTGNNPAAGDAVFLYESATTYTGPVTLLGQQKLIGQDAGADLSTLTGITPATGSDALPAMNTGGSAVTINGGSGGVVLGADNLLRGFAISTTGGTALSGTGFGTPTISEVPITATGGAALSLDNGTLNTTFATLSSTNSTGRGISLTSVSGTLTVTAGSISGAAQAAFLVSGGGVGVTFPGNITQGSNAPLLDVAAGHTGTLAFSGTLTATNGSGLQFNDADGTYTFSGSAALGGTDAGVDITNGSGGTFNFNASTQITNTGGTGLNVYGSAPTLVSYAGSITKNGTSTGRLVDLGEMTGGTVTFPVGSTLSATSTSNLSTGIGASNVAATVNFNGTTTLNGGDAGVDITGGSSGTFVFGANTLVQNPSGTAFNVNGSAPNVTFNGSLIRTANNALLVDLTTVAAGKTITFDPAAGTDSLYATIGDGIQLSNVDGAVDFNGRVRLAGGNAGVDIVNGSSGNIDFDAATIVNPTGDALRIFNGSGGDQTTDVSFAGSISTNAGRPVLVEDVGASSSVAISASINATGQGILVQNNSGGTITFSSATQTLNTAANAAVTLANNTGATVNFTGGALAITTAAGAGFSASGGGTVNVEGTTNTVSSTTGTPVSISSTTIGANGVRFRSVSANGAANGIFLNNTGASGGQFRVDGTGTVGSGGSILNTSGGDGATSGNGVYLNSVRNVVLSGMIINDHPNFGIFGQTVNGFTLDNSRLAGTHGTNVGLDESVISFTGLDGQVVFSNDSISGGIEDNVRILNHGVVSAATDSILFNNVRMGHVNSATGNTALLVRVADGSTNRVRIRNSTFHGSRGGSTFHLNVVNTATARLALDANTFHNTQTQISGAGGVLITASGTAASVPTLTYNITNNSFRGSRTVALNINKDVGQAVINGNISNNVIGDAAITNSGSSEASGIQLRHQGGGTHRATVTNNQIFQYNNYGIILEEGDAVAGGGHGRMDVTMTGNTVSNPGTLAFSWNGLHANIGTVTDDAHVLCLAASGNSMDNSGAATQDIRLRQRMKTTIILPGYPGAASDNTAVNNFVKANNGNGAGLTVVASNSVGVAAPNGPGNGFINGSCNAPTF